MFWNREPELHQLSGAGLHGPDRTKQLIESVKGESKLISNIFDNTRPESVTTREEAVPCSTAHQKRHRNKNSNNEMEANDLGNSSLKLPIAHGVQEEKQWDDPPKIPWRVQQVLGEMGARLLGKENHVYLGLMGIDKAEVEIGLEQYDTNPPWSTPRNPCWAVIHAVTEGSISVAPHKLQIMEANVLDRMDGRRIRKCLSHYIKQESSFKDLPVEAYVEELRKQIFFQLGLWEEMESILLDWNFRGAWEENVANHVFMWRARDVCWRFLKLKHLQSCWRPGEIYLGSDLILWDILTTKIYDD